MTPKEKIAFVKERLKEAAETHPSGAFVIELIPIVDIEANGGIPDDAPVLLSRKEQWSIIQKLQEEEFVQDVKLDEDGRSVHLALTKPKTRRSNLFAHITTTDELIQHRELLEKFLAIIKSVGDISPKGYYKIPVDEANDDLVQLLIDLKIADYDWDEMQKQTHREIGNRIIELGFSGAAVLALRDRISGKGGRIKREALELVCKDIGERFTFNKMVRLCTDLGVPETMFIQDTKWRALFYVLSYLTTSTYEDYLLALKIVQETLHPLVFGADEEKAKKTREKYKKWLKYDRIEIDEAGKVYVCPTNEEFDVGIEDWMSVDGKMVEPRGYLIYPDRVAGLWVLWSQAIVLVQAYQSNPSLDRKALEALYLELISYTEDLISGGGLGSLPDTYKRPFTSLATAELEAMAKGAESPLALVSTLLLEIIALEPAPQEIAKKMEENAEFIERITASTRAISGEDIDVAQLSHEQALFVLKLIIGRIQKILDVSCSGYLVGADEEINAQYITLLDKLNAVCEREDFSDLKENLPQYLPSHLFEALDEMDVWWDNGGKTSIVSFYGEIELFWVRSGRQVFPVSQAFAAYLDSVDEGVKKLRNEKAARWKRTLEDIDERKAEGEFGFASPEPKADTQNKVIHEHTHRFENSADALAFKMEITKMPDLQVRNIDDAPIIKGKRRVYPPKFSSTEWSKVSIRFINERDVVLTAGTKQVVSDYEALGFGNAKTNKPDSAWMFLLELARKGGVTDTLPKPIPENIKQHKKTISDRLKILFKNDTDPFQDPTDTRVYRVKLTVVPPETDTTPADTLGVNEYLAQAMPQQYDPNEDI
jgi:hypothetical protein